MSNSPRQSHHPRRSREAGATVLGALLLSLLAGSAHAQTAPDAARVHATHYGEGMRAYIEGHYDRAVEHLFQAYALKPNAQTMRMILRAYDFMGNCDAVGRQLVLFRESYANAPVPTVQQCEKPATVTFQCDGFRRPLRVDGLIHARCDRPVRLSPGRHHVEVVGANHGRDFTAPASRTQTIKLKFKPRKWSPASPSRTARVPILIDQHGARVPLLVDHRPHVPLLVDPQRARVPILVDQHGRYTIMMDHDGLYRIVRPGTAKPGARYLCEQDSAGQTRCKPVSR